MSTSVVASSYCVQNIVAKSHKTQTSNKTNIQGGDTRRMRLLRMKLGVLSRVLVARLMLSRLFVNRPNILQSAGGLVNFVQIFDV